MQLPGRVPKVEALEVSPLEDLLVDSSVDASVEESGDLLVGPLEGPLEGVLVLGDARNIGSVDFPVRETRGVRFR